MNQLLYLMIFSILITFSPSEAITQENRLSIRGSNLEIPRFVTLKSNRINMRAGPGRRYPILWQYQRRGLPLKVIGEFDVWRKVIDHDDNTGWMHVSTLSVKRMGLVIASTATIHKNMDKSSPIIAVAENGVLMELVQCSKDWCRIEADAVLGWIDRKSIWGILEDETL